MFQEDLSIFFDDMGTEISFNNKCFTGIFDNQDIEVSDEYGVGGIITQQPKVLMQESDFKSLGIKTGSKLIIKSTVYEVRDVLHDGTGVTNLILRLAS